MNKQEQIGFTKEIQSFTARKFIILSVAVIIVLGFIAYGNSLNGEFLWDDTGLIRDNLYIKTTAYLPKIFSRDVVAGAGKGSRFYRPFQMITYMVDYSLWKDNVRGYHLTCILVHILAALSIYWLTNILFKDNLLSFLTGSFFVVHPVRTEAVTYISGRADPLSLLFMLLCFVFYIKSSLSKNTGMYILMLCSYILALLSRESSLILPLLLLLYHYSFKKELNNREFSSIVSLAAIYVILRLTMLRSLLSYHADTATLFQRLPGFFVAITDYIRLLFLPVDLHMEYGMKLLQFGDLKVVLGAVILVFLLVSAVRNREKNKLIFFSLFWFIITLLPVSNLYHVNAYMAEHWLYVPSIGFFILIAWLVSLLYRTEKFRILAIILVTGLLIFYSFLTIKQNTYWRDPLTFFKRTLRYAPESSSLHNNLGNAYAALNNNEEAIILFKKALEIKPDHGDAYYNLGNAYAALNDKEAAIASYKKAVENSPNHANAYCNLGRAYEDLNKREEAIASYKKALDIRGDHVAAHKNLGAIYSRLDNKEEAIASYERAVRINPNDANAYNNLGIVYASFNRNEEAIALYRKAIKIEPDYAKAYNNLGRIYKALGRDEVAEVSYKKAIEIDPDYADAHINLGVVYADSKRNEQAMISYKKAIEIDPDYADAYYNLGILHAELNNKEEAIVLYMKAIELKPDHLDAYNNLGAVYLATNKIEEAIELFKKTIEIAPDYATAYNNLTAVYFHLKQYEKAIEYCDKAEELGHKVSLNLREALKPYRK